VPLEVCTGIVINLLARAGIIELLEALGSGDREALLLLCVCMLNTSSHDAYCIIICDTTIVRTTIDLPEPLLRNAKRRASERGVTLSAVVEDALRYLLAARPKGPETPFRLHTVRGRLVQPDLDLDRTSALVTLDDESDFTAGQS